MGVLARTLIASAGLAGTGCGDAELDPAPSWIPADEIEGAFRPEIQQVASPAAPRNNLRILSFNVQEGLEVEALADYLGEDPTRAEVDVLLLQECDRGAGESDAARLAARLGMGHVYAPKIEIDEGTRGLAILSRFVLLEIEVMLLREADDLGIVTPDPRGALAATIETPGGRVRFVDVHLDVPLSITERILQLRPAVIDAPTPIVVAGDFNTNDYVWAEDVPLLPLDAVADTAQAPALDRYMRQLGYATPTAALGNTWDGLPEDQRLDAIFTRGVAVGDRTIDRALELSDHWPIWLDLDTASP